MTTVYIRLIRSHNFTARLIHLGMWLWAVLRFKKIRRTYNHCEVGYDNLSSGAIAKGVKTRDWNVVLKEHKWMEWMEYKIELTQDEWIKGYSYLVDVEDTKYEFENFWWHLVKIITGKWKGSTKAKELYCYEHGIRFLNATGKYKLNNYMNPYEFKLWCDRNLYSQKHKYVKGKYLY